MLESWFKCRSPLVTGNCYLLLFPGLEPSTLLKNKPSIIRILVWVLLRFDILELYSGTISDPLLHHGWLTGGVRMKLSICSTPWAPQKLGISTLIRLSKHLKCWRVYKLSTHIHTSRWPGAPLIIMIRHVDMWSYGLAQNHFQVLKASDNNVPFWSHYGSIRNALKPYISRHQSQFESRIASIRRSEIMKLSLGFPQI